MNPKFLTKKSKIYFIAPSFGCATSPYKERLEKSIKTFQKMGFSVILGENCFKAEGVASSNTPLLRAKEFTDAYLSDADAILSVGGGEVMIEILEYIDFNKIKKLPPKWFIGFSDNTNLVYTLTTICNIQTIYGPNAAKFYRYPLEYDTLDCWRMLSGDNEFKGYESFQFQDNKGKYPKYKFDHKKVITPYFYTQPFTGILIGGCLDCLVNLCGTKFDYTKSYIQSHKENKIIFYLESCDLNSVGIRRALTQLKYAGWFTNIGGFLVGRTKQYYDTSFYTTPNEAYIDILSSYQVPILLNVDIGHISPSLPIKNGAIATIDYKNENIYITYKD